jgi:hypothetical protein
MSSSFLLLMRDSPTRSEKVISIDLFLQSLSNFSIFLLFSFQICSSKLPPSLKIYFPFLSCFLSFLAFFVLSSPAFLVLFSSFLPPFLSYFLRLLHFLPFLSFFLALLSLPYIFHPFCSQLYNTFLLLPPPPPKVLCYCLYICFLPKAPNKEKAPKNM